MLGNGDTAVNVGRHSRSNSAGNRGEARPVTEDDGEHFMTSLGNELVTRDTTVRLVGTPRRRQQREYT